MNKDVKQHLYFDVTQLIHWSGNLTGIPKVANELATRYAKQPDTIFVAWVKEIEQFCEVNFLQTIAQRGQGIVYIKLGETVESSGQVARISITLQKRLTKKAIRTIKKLLRRSERLNSRLVEQIKERLILRRISQYKIMDAKPGDQLFIPWGEWWDGRFTKRLIDLKTDGIKLIHVIHDIATTTCPQFYEQVAISPTEYNGKVLPLVDMVLAVSENTKLELTNWLKANKLHVPTIKVFRNGEDLRVSKPVKPTDAQFEAANLQGGFLLTVGTIELKKNHLLYYYVYKLAKARGIELPPLIIVGRLGWMGEAAFTLMSQDPEVKDKFILLLSTGDEQLSWLYDNCLFTIFASFHEGWGIPIAESLARGVPCLCSNTSSMVEIAEDYVEHFSPASADELLAGIQRWLNSQELKRAREKTKKYQQFSWDKSFQQITKLIEEEL